MPNGTVKLGTNCRVCIDCEPMTSGNFRCYGENKSHTAPLKMDFSIDDIKPHKLSPDWCPHRKVNYSDKQDYNDYDDYAFIGYFNEV